MKTEESIINHKDESFGEAKRELRASISQRKASLTIGEQNFLNSLIIEDNEKEFNENMKETKSNEKSALRTLEDLKNKQKERMTRAKNVLENSLLFSRTFENRDQWSRAIESGEPEETDIKLMKSLLDDQHVQPRRTSANSSYQMGLWRSYDHGVPPQKLARFRSNSSSVASANPINEEKEILGKNETKDCKEEFQKKCKEGDDANERGDIDIDFESEGRTINDGKKESSNGINEDHNSNSSWALDEKGFNHYDAWEVLKDEYAKDFGFGLATLEGDFPPDNNDDTDQRGPFKILGTSSDDISAHPHVLSPSLMDSLLNFVTDSVADQNFWLKFSLIRDGASLDTLRQYCRAATQTILAIETTDGRVFGSFTSSPWHLNPAGYFGTGESFLWKMRQSRATPCRSLMEQAQMESEIDVYYYSHTNDYVQLCTSDKIALGSGELDTTELDTTGQENHNNHDIVSINESNATIEEGEPYGFGIAISGDLLRGTTSQCTTFRNPSRGEIFEIVNLEVRSFSPMGTVAEAEHLEMTNFFVQESVMPSFCGDDLRQEDFYRRAGTGRQCEEEE